MLPDIQVGDIVHMRKQHPCGGLSWEVTRIGADIASNARHASAESCSRAAN